MAIALPHSLTQMPVSRFWIFWLQFTAGGATAVRSCGLVEDSSAIWLRVSSALSCASSLTAIVSVGPPAHALDAV